MTANILTFLIGPVLIFFLVQNNCEETTTTLNTGIESNRARSQVPVPPNGSGGGNLTNCSSASECPNGSGCLSLNAAGGKPVGTCVECNLALDLISPGYVVEGCSSSGGSGGGANTTPALGFTCVKSFECQNASGYYGCATASINKGGGVSAIMQACIPCDEAAEATSQYGAHVVGCFDGQTRNAITHYLLVVPVLGFLSNSYVAYRPVIF